MLQISEQSFEALIYCFVEWRYWQCRANNRIKPNRLRTILRMVYEGRRLHGIMREAGEHHRTLAILRRDLNNFLLGHDQWPAPICACGLPLFHHSVCPVWDTYHAGAVARGHVTQSQAAQQRYADAFFEMAATNLKTTGICQCGCGQRTTRLRHDDPVYGQKAGDFKRFVQGHYMAQLTRKRLAADPNYRPQSARAAEREELAEEISEFLAHGNPTSMRVIHRHFAGRGFEPEAISRLVRRHEGTENLRAIDEETADIFFQTTQAMNALTSTPKTDLATQAQQFCRLIQQGIDAWTDAGKLLVAMIEAEPNARQTILDLNPDVTEEILARFEAIGRNQLHPKTLLNNSPGMRRLRALPFSEQTKFLQQPVPVLIKTQAGVDTLNVAVKNLTAQQAMQVFTPNGVRSAEAQRAWIESRRNGKRPAQGAPYTIKGSKVTFRADCEMTARELAQVLAQLS